MPATPGSALNAKRGDRERIGIRNPVAFCVAMKLQREFKGKLESKSAS